MTAASVNLQGTEPAGAQEGLHPQLRAWAGDRVGATDAFDAIFTRSLNRGDRRLVTPLSAQGRPSEAQVSPLGPQAAEHLAASAQSRASATNRLAERDVQARQVAGADQPRLSEQLADAHRRQTERGASDTTAAEVAKAGATGEAGRVGQAASGERATTSGQQAEASAARGDAGGRSANSEPSTGSTESNGTDGRSSGQQASSQGNAVSAQAQAQAPSANISGNANSGAVGRAGAVAPVSGGPAASPANTGSSQNTALNFSQALQGAKGSNAATKAAGAAPSDTLQRLVDADSKSLVQGVSRGLFAAVKQNGGSLTMRLHPASLGQLKIEMSIQGNSVTADITTTTEQAQRLLADSLTALRSVLESKGLTVTQLNVNHAPQTTAATHAPHSSQPGAEQEGSNPHNPHNPHSNPNDPQHSHSTHDPLQGLGAEDGGDGGARDDQSESQGGGSFTWHIPVPDPGAERTQLINDEYVVSALNVVA